MFQYVKFFLSQILILIPTDGELDWYMSWQPYIPEWRALSGCSAAVEEKLSCGDSITTPPRSRPQDLSCADRDPRPEGVRKILYFIYCKTRLIIFILLISAFIIGIKRVYMLTFIYLL